MVRRPAKTTRDTLLISSITPGTRENEADAVSSGMRLLLNLKFGAGGNAAEFQENGWASPEDGFTWSVGSSSTLLLPPIEEGETTLIIRGSPFRYGTKLRRQRICFLLNDQELAAEQAFGDSTFVLELGRKLSARSPLKFVALYPDATSPSTFGINDDRTLAFAWRSLEIFRDTSRALGAFSTAPLNKDIVSEKLYSWARREMLPWIANPLDQATSELAYERINATMPWAALYRFSAGQVHLEPKPSTLALDVVSVDRAREYLSFLQSAARRLPPGCGGTICLSGADLIEGQHEVPVFMFQKLPGEAYILVPDIEFIQKGFYEADIYRDPRLYSAKTSTAVFAGATTGGPITKEVADKLSLPRLEAAGYFENNIRVDFRLPHVVQCSSVEAEAVLKQKSFCIRSRLTWNEQFRHRFLISMDGNGATCSRVAISLLSNSVLLKYNSPHRLYYFDGLAPWVNYVPIDSHATVEAVLSMDLQDTARFRAVAENGRAFASDYLTRARAEEYMANLLMLYFSTF